MAQSGILETLQGDGGNPCTGSHQRCSRTATASCAQKELPKLRGITEELATAPSVARGHIDQSGDRWRTRLVRA